LCILWFSDFMSASRVLRRYALPTGAALGLTWAHDEFYGYQRIQRTLLTVKTGAILLYEYKVRWTPETSDDVHDRVSKRLVDCLKRNEGLYVKFGQAMATMDVVLPEEYKRELHTLHDKAATCSFPEARRVVEAELGKRLEEVFLEFEEQPIASASIAQVHRARLRPSAIGEAVSKESEGLQVAVKIQKPNIPAQNACDLATYKVILNVLEYAFDLPLAWTYDYTRRQLEAELDFRIEASNAQRAAKELDECPQLRGKVMVPKVFDEVSGRHVMVMEWIDSIGAVSDGEALKREGFSASEVMETATKVFGYQIFSTGHVHCDPHPGNLLVRLAPSECKKARQRWQLVLLDHGLYCELSNGLRQEYADFWVAATLGDAASAVQICQRWGIVDKDAAELFASLTQFRRVRLGTGRVNAVSDLFAHGSTKPQSPAKIHYRKLTPEETAAAQARLKARAKKLLGDTKAFPQELFFVGRNLNIIRSANFNLGRIVNRVAILAECAAEGSVLNGSLASLDSTTRQIALFKFHARVWSLLVADRFFKTWHSANQIFMWSRGMLGKLYMCLLPDASE